MKNPFLSSLTLLRNLISKLKETCVCVFVFVSGALHLPVSHLSSAGEQFCGSNQWELHRSVFSAAAVQNE